MVEHRELRQAAPPIVAAVPDVFVFLIVGQISTYLGSSYAIVDLAHNFS